MHSPLGRSWLVLLTMLALFGCGGPAEPLEADSGSASPDAGAPTPDASTEACKGFDELDAPDQRLLEIMSQLFIGFEEGAERFWSADYRFDQYPFVFVRRDQGEGLGSHSLLINFESAEGTPICLPERLSNLGEVLWRETLERYPEDWRWWDMSYRLDGETAALFVYGDAAPASVDNEQWPDFVVHELFHRFQIEQSMWSFARNWTQDVDMVPLTPENAALSLLENKALLAALEARTDDERRAGIEDFLVLRQERVRQWPIVSRYDEPQEHLEGPARFVEIGVDDLLYDAGLDHIYGLVLYGGDPAEISSEAGEWFTKDRYYISGAAILLLVNEYNSDWKNDISSTSPADMLREAVPVPEDEERLEQVKTRYDYEAVLEQAQSFNYDYEPFPMNGMT